MSIRRLLARLRGEHARQRLVAASTSNARASRISFSTGKSLTNP
jgi:hypothetical protein